MTKTNKQTPLTVDYYIQNMAFIFLECHTIPNTNTQKIDKINGLGRFLKWITIYNRPAVVCHFDSSGSGDGGWRWVVVAATFGYIYANHFCDALC